MFHFSKEFTFTMENYDCAFTVPYSEYKGLKVARIDELEEQGYDFTYGGDISIGKIDGNEPVIFMNEKIFVQTQSQKSMVFFLEHEIGHYKSGHLDHDLEYLNRNQYSRAYAVEVIPEELEADRYAASVLGVEYCVQALKENIGLLKKCFPSLTDFTNPVYELNKRLHALNGAK
jgi:hypothetical protein